MPGRKWRSWPQTWSDYDHLGFSQNWERRPGHSWAALSARAPPPTKKSRECPRGGGRRGRAGHGRGEGREALTGHGAWAAAGTSPGAAAGAPHGSASCEDDRPAPSRLRLARCCLEPGAGRSWGPGRGHLGGRGPSCSHTPTTPPKAPHVPTTQGLDSAARVGPRTGVHGNPAHVGLGTPAPRPCPCAQRAGGETRGVGWGRAGWAPLSREDLSQGHPRGACRPSGELPALGSPDCLAPLSQ